MDDTGFEHDVPGDELERVRRALAELGEQPLPQAVAKRLDARLAAELTTSPLSVRRARRQRLRLGAALSAAAAVAAAVVFALGTGGNGHPPAAQQQAAALQSSVASATADSAGKSAPAAPEGVRAGARKCRPASRTGGDRRPAACPGARGGHARAV